MVFEINDIEKKKAITRKILEALPEWFGIPEAREEYIRESVQQPFFAAMDEETPVGFLYLKKTGKDTVELAAMGVLKEFHHKGIGRELFLAAKEKAGKDGPGIYIRKIIFDLGHPAYPCHYAVPGRVRIAFAYGAGS